MANIIIKRRVSMEGPVMPEAMAAPLYHQENEAHQFEIEATRDGAPIALTGTVQGRIIRADGQTVAMTGTISGGKAALTLPQSAYTVPGRFTLAIMNVTSGVVTVIYAAAGSIARTTTDTVIDPGSLIPDLTQLLAEIDEMRLATAAANAAASKAVRYDTAQSLYDSEKAQARANIGAGTVEEIQILLANGNVANHFSASRSYVTGEFVISPGGMLYYVARNRAAGAWSDSDVYPTGDVFVGAAATSYIMRTADITAELFDPARDYLAGEYVAYEYRLYQFTAPFTHTGSFPTTGIRRAHLAEDVNAARGIAEAAVRYDSTQSLTDTQKAMARGNVDALGTAQGVRYDVNQNLTAAHKQQGRENIDAASVTALEAEADAREAAVTDLTNQLDDVFDAVSGDDAPTWEIGGINASNGNNTTSSIRVRTVAAIDITPYIDITVPDGAYVNLRPYKASGTFVAYGTTKFTGTFNLADTISVWLGNHPDVTKMRFVGGFTDDRTITAVTDLPVTITNPVLVNSVELKSRLDNLIDTTLSVSAKAADAATVGTGLYRAKSRTSNYPAGLTCWRATLDGYSSSNKFKPNDMPPNSYCAVTGDFLDGFTPSGVTPVSGYVYWIFKFYTPNNTNVILYYVVCPAINVIYSAHTGTGAEYPTFKQIGGEEPSTTLKIMMFGDSITRGINSDAYPGTSVWSAVNIPNLVSAELGCVVDNYGIGSIGWIETGGSAKGTALDYLKRVGDSDWYWDGSGSYINNKFIGTPKTWSDYNTVILAFGANDRAFNGNATDLGSLDGIDDTMTYAQVMAMEIRTIVDAMYQCYRYIREQAPTINIILSDPLMQKGGSAPWWSYPTRYSPSKWSWDELNEMYAAFAKRYGLGHISNYDAPINRVDPTISLADNVHPTTDCYRQLGRHFAGKISALVL